MTLDEVQAVLEERTRGWGSEVRTVHTGGGPKVYLATLDRVDGERVVLEVRSKPDGLVADVSLEESGRVLVEEKRLTVESDLDSLMDALPRPYGVSVINVACVRRLNIFK